MIEYAQDADSGCILVADNTPQTLALLSDLLRSRGFYVVSLTSSLAVLAEVAEHAFDLMLIDADMPEMDGYQLCRQLKADPSTQDIPVILLSKALDTDGILKAFDAGAVDYIAKPFKLREVLARVTNHLMLVRQRKQIAALREQDRQTYRALDGMKNQFLSMATHDLKSPLNILLGYTGLLAEVDVMEHDRDLRDQAIREMQHSIEKMHGLVTSILDLAQMETRATMNVEVLPLQPILEHCLHSFEVVALEKNVHLGCHLPDEPLIAKVDVHRLTRALDNLLSNAIKYTPEGGRVELNAVRDANYAVIEVSDTGYGIPEEVIPRVFDAFFRVDDARHRASEGSGLGLAIVKTIVEQHNGALDVVSELDKGSTFRMRLPIHVGES